MIKLAERSNPDFQSEFLAKILKGNTTSGLITFAGGNPNSDSLPVAAINAAAEAVMKENGVKALQYSNPQGYLPLREYIADYYKKDGIDIDPSEIIITNGSQQALELFSHVMIDEGDSILVESPTYLAALQVFHLYNAKIVPIALGVEGIDVDQLKAAIDVHKPKFMYIIPSFQNPTGLSYSKQAREKIAEAFKGTDTLLLEDNPYGELYFYSKPAEGFAHHIGEQCVMLGTFSKIISPGMRIGWIACKQKAIVERMRTYKATTDLHTNIFAQMVLERFIRDNSLEEHIARNRQLYRHNAELMVSCIDKYFPKACTCTKPQGGMFLWVTLPNGLKGIDVQTKTIERGTAVCAGDPFFEDRRDVPYLRMNFSNYTDEIIEKGMKVVGEVIAELLQEQKADCNSNVND